MNKFIVYRHSSGEFCFIRRNHISSFKPEFISKFQYRIMVTADGQEFIAAEVESMEAAEAWIMAQIRLIEESETPAQGAKK